MIFLICAYVAMTILVTGTHLVIFDRWVKGGHDNRSKPMRRLHFGVLLLTSGTAASMAAVGHPFLDVVAYTMGVGSLISFSWLGSASSKSTGVILISSAVGFLCGLLINEPTAMIGMWFTVVVSISIRMTKDDDLRNVMESYTKFYKEQFKSIMYTITRTTPPE